MTSRMTKERACALLDILTSEQITVDEIKTQYRLQALKYHPDKNKDANATETFQAIREAYDYLLQNPEMLSQVDDSFTNYETMFGSFVSSLFFQESAHDTSTNTFSKYSEDDADEIRGNSRERSSSEFDSLPEFFTHSKTELCRLIVSKIVGLCQTRALQYIEKIDRTTLRKIYTILEKYRSVGGDRNGYGVHISEIIMHRIAEILSKKTECVLLNPSLDDLIVDNLYKITENGQTFIVPLWHHELIYDNSGAEFMVRCNPILPEHMEMDEDNHIYIYLNYRLSELWENETITVPFGKTTVEFQTHHLSITRTTQTIRLRNRGIAHIHASNMFDNSVRKDVVLVIHIVGL